MGQTHEVSSNITDQQQENEMRRSEKPREGGGDEGRMGKGATDTGKAKA